MREEVHVPLTLHLVKGRAQLLLNVSLAYFMTMSLPPQT